MGDSRTEWQYDEFRHVGTDYGSLEEVEDYDRRMSKLRDVPHETEAILGMLGLGPESAVLEIGTGTGEFAIRAAARCAKVHAIDISEMMLEFARRKAAARDVGNIAFSHAGFLTFDKEIRVDAVVTQLALHHLPDYWKAVALSRIRDALKDSGRLFIKDVVFPDDVRKCDEFFTYWLSGAQEIGGEQLRCEAARHIKDEYSTTRWIMEGLLENAGFEVKADYSDIVFASYLCAKSDN